MHWCGMYHYLIAVSLEDKEGADWYVCTATDEYNARVKCHCEFTGRGHTILIVLKGDPYDKDKATKILEET